MQEQETLCRTRYGIDCPPQEELPKEPGQGGGQGGEQAAARVGSTTCARREGDHEHRKDSGADTYKQGYIENGKKRCF